MIYLLCPYTMYCFIGVIFIALDQLILCASKNVIKLKNPNLLFETNQMIKRENLTIIV
jgi:hypothetical protein